LGNLRLARLAPKKEESKNVNPIEYNPDLWFLHVAEMCAIKMIEELSLEDLRLKGFPDDLTETLNMVDAEGTSLNCVSPFPGKEIVLRDLHKGFLEYFGAGKGEEDMKPHDLKLWLEVEKGVMALDILKLCFELEAQTKETGVPDSALAFYLAGFLHGCMNSGQLVTAPNTMEAWRSLLSVSAQKKRWNVRNERFTGAVAMADELYRRGDPRMHHEMVDHLLNTHPAFQEIRDGDEYTSCRRRLLRELGRLAKEKYPDRFYSP